MNEIFKNNSSNLKCCRSRCCRRCKKTTPPFLGANDPEDGYFDVLNYGGFALRFFVTYIYNGSKFDPNTETFYIGQSRRIYFPKTATNITLKVQLDMFINVWVDLLYSSYQKADQLCFVAYGVTAFPEIKQIPCTSPN